MKSEGIGIREIYFNEKGITLITLVVTIIILLILAGITINLVLSDGGIFEKAQYAKNEWENAVSEEQEVLGNMGNSIDSIISSRNPTTNKPNGIEYNFGWRKHEWFYCK